MELRVGVVLNLRQWQRGTLLDSCMVNSVMLSRDGGGGMVGGWWRRRGTRCAKTRELSMRFLPRGIFCSIRLHVRSQRVFY